jgi:type IV secretion system protein VirB10
MEDSEDSVPESPDAGPSYETTPGEATGFDGAEEPRFFNRKRLMIVLSLVFSLVAGGGLILNVNKSKKTETETAAAASAARAPAEFLRNQRDRALAARPEDAGMPEDPPAPAVPEPPGPPAPVPYPYPSATAPAPPPPPPPQAPAAPGRTPQQPDPLRAALRSPLVPGIEGSILGAGQIPSFMQNAAGTGQYLDAGALGRNAAGDYIAQALAARQPLPQLSPVSSSGSPQDPYAVQNAQDNKQGFYQPGSGGALNNGQFIGDNALWIGTIVPGVLETGINTDLPGDVIARVTQNVYDSRTGKHLLIPQGTLLAARYNSSVSYAQKRVQIAWDTLIRPDGFQIDLGGMNAADRAGYSGQEAEYHENWFEYLKAAGIIALFSVANSKMTEEAAKYSSPETASAVAQANSQFVNQLGGNIVSRAMNIQPSLTVDSGTLINIMLNKTVYLPPLEDYPVSQKYSLK